MGCLLTLSPKYDIHLRRPVRVYPLHFLQETRPMSKQIPKAAGAKTADSMGKGTKSAKGLISGKTMTPAKAVTIGAGSKTPIKVSTANRSMDPGSDDLAKMHTSKHR